MNISILNRSKNVIDFLTTNGNNQVLNKIFDDEYTQELDTGAESYSFSVFSNYRTEKCVEVGNYVIFKYNNIYKMFQIIELEISHNEKGVRIITAYCESVGLELITDYTEPFEIEGNIKLFLSVVLQDTDWKVGNVDEELLTNIQHIKVDKNENVLKVLQDNIETYNNVEYEFRVEFNNNIFKGCYIDVYANENRGRKTNRLFTYENNIKSITKKINLENFASAGIGESSECDFKDVEWIKANGDPTDKPKGQNFVVNPSANDKFNKGNKYIKKPYSFDTSDPTTLLELTWEALLKDAEPKIDYEVEVAMACSEYKDLNIGDTVLVRDFDFDNPLLLSARVGTLTISFADDTIKRLTFSNYKEVTSKMSELDFANIIKNIQDYINSLETGILTEAQIDQLAIYLKQMNVEKSEIDNIVAELKKIAQDKLEEAQRNHVDGEYVDILLNDSTRNYICDTVKSIKFRLPNTNGKTFSTTLKFTTQKDTEPTKFYQSTLCWLTGLDCINGALIPHADTTYTINIMYNSDAPTYKKYTGIVTKVYHGGSYSTYINKTDYTDKIKECMQSYYNVRDKFVYSTTTPYSFKDPTTATNQEKWKTNGKFHIDCSSFVQFVLRGITYINSTYNHPDKSPYYLSTKYKYSFVLDSSISDRDRFASDMARACIEQGLQLDLDMSIKSNWTKLQTGDIVFWSQRLGEESAVINERYMQVGHVAIVSSVLDDGDITTYEATSNINTILNRRLSNNYPEKVLFVARPRR